MDHRLDTAATGAGRCRAVAPEIRPRRAEHPGRPKHDVRGTLEEGARLDLEMKLEDGSTTPVNVVVVEVVQGRKLHQRAGMPGVLTANHFWLLDAVSGGTRVALRKRLEGTGEWVSTNDQ